MLVDMQVAYRLYVKVNQRMPGQLFEHMIKKADARVYFIYSTAIEVDLDINRRFVRLAADSPGAHGRRYSHVRAIGNRTVLILQASQSTKHP
jgi:hypothetical protein